MNTVSQQVTEREKIEQNRSFWSEEKGRLPWIAVGILIYSIGINMFLRPLHLYSGGFMGFSQLITTLLRDRAGISFGSLDLSGIFYYIMNLPALILAIRCMRRRFIVKTLITVTLITVSLTLIPIPSAPVLEEMLANCMVAGIMAGAGIGLVLRAGSCDGGIDLIGMLLIHKGKHISVGRINIMINVILYGICILLFDVPTVIYSLIYSVFCSMICDRVHTQNINVQVLIVTKLKDTQPLEIEIMGRMARGLTKMHAKGSYTDEDATVFMTVISKYEIPQLLAIVQQYDRSAFLMLDEGVRVEGNFLKKIT